MLTGDEFCVSHNCQAAKPLERRIIELSIIQDIHPEGDISMVDAGGFRGDEAAWV